MLWQYVGNFILLKIFQLMTAQFINVYYFAVLPLDEKLAKGQNHGRKAKLIQTSNFFSNHCRSLLQEKGRQFKQWCQNINFIHHYLNNFGPVVNCLNLSMT